MSGPRSSTTSSRLRYAVDETPSDGLTLGLRLAAERCSRTCGGATSSSRVTAAFAP